MILRLPRGTQLGPAGVDRRSSALAQHQPAGSDPLQRGRWPHRSDPGRRSANVHAGPQSGMFSNFKTFKFVLNSILSIGSGHSPPHRSDPPTAGQRDSVASTIQVHPRAAHPLSEADATHLEFTVLKKRATFYLMKLGSIFFFCLEYLSLTHTT